MGGIGTGKFDGIEPKADRLENIKASITEKTSIVEVIAIAAGWVHGGGSLIEENGW
jgi:hypothetical protein